MILYALSNETACMRRRTGDFSEEGTPVPIPNTVVKLFSPDDTVGANPWENRKLPFHLPTRAVFYLFNRQVGVLSLVCKQGRGTDAMLYLYPLDLCQLDPIQIPLL